MANKTSSNMARLLQNASKMEKEVKDTDNVAITVGSESENKEKRETAGANLSQTEEKEKAVLSEKIEEKQEEKARTSSSKKDEFNSLFKDRKIKETEVIRISAETHAKLKRLSNVTDISMHVLASNILDEAFEKYNKEIQAAIKKYMNL